MNKKLSIITAVLGITALLGVVAIIGQAHLRDNKALDKISLDAKAAKFVKKNPVKAMIYGLWVNGQPVSINALGESMTQVPANTKMHVRIGGITEPMLTTLLMQLVDNKQVALDDSIAKWFPNLPNANQVTLHMLANGTSGYPDYVYNETFMDKELSEPFKHWTSNELIDYAMEKEPLFEPGSNQHYSHTDYVLLGEIISQIQKQPIAQIFEEMIFRKSEMHNTAFNLTPEIPSPVLHAFSQDRKIYEDSTFWDPSWTSTSGAITSTIGDLGKWGQDFMEGDFLTPAANAQLRAPDTVGKGNNKPDLYFAMGFGVANHWLIQNPSFGGYSGIFAILPEKQIVFVAFNTQQESDKDDVNYSQVFWQQIASNLAPEYPLPTME
ncbi:serine hydrolase domain-containing protein [Legionella sp. W05-934-2]|uniref:serine hydrolase domain-containing protein n=1 Tax=Legionella sp. W05-934-2 TaxID=1198649 RepID=UPI0034618BCF